VVNKDYQYRLILT